MAAQTAAMRHAKSILLIQITAVIIAACPLYGGLKLQVRNGLPIVDDIYVNGHGPYRFLVDTGSNVNLIDPRVAKEIGMTITFQTDLESAAGKMHILGSDGNEIDLDSVKANDQKLVFSTLEAIRRTLPEVQGVLGEWFLSHFDYVLDLQHREIEFGKQERSGTRIPYKIVNARPVISTNLGDLVLDSGTARVTIFGVERTATSNGMLRTLAGTQQVGLLSGEALVINKQRVWSGDAIAIGTKPEREVNGLLPLSLFKAVYFCNSEQYVILE